MRDMVTGIDEKRTTRFDSPAGQKNQKPCEGSPPQGLSGARRGNEVYGKPEFSPGSPPGLRIRRGGAPSGAAAFIATGGMGVSTSIFIPEVQKNYSPEIFCSLTRFPLVTKVVKGVLPKGRLPLRAREGVNLPRFSEINRKPKGAT